MSQDARSRLSHLSDQERRSLVDRLLNSRKTAQVAEIQPRPRTSPTAPLSYAQQRYWVLNQIFPNTTGFNVVRVFHLKGALDADAFRASLSDLTARHEALRTVFEPDGGTPVQRVRSSYELVPEFVDLRPVADAERSDVVKRLAYQEGQRLWDLASVPPIRTSLWQLADDEHVFVLAMHHIISDGWSMNTVLGDLFASYNARREGRAPSWPEVKLQYADYAVWQRRWLESERSEPQLSFWRRRMAGSPTLRLPTAPLGSQTAAGFTRRVLLAPDLTQRVKALTQAEGVTLFMALLAGFALLLSRYAAQDDVVVGSPVASRTRPELENVVGCFMNPLPFRVELSGDPTFRQLLARVRDVAVEVYANQDVPFDAIVKAVAPQHQSALPPLYQAMFLLHNFPTEARKALQAGAVVDGLQVTHWPLMTADLGADEERQLATDRIFPVALEMVEVIDRIAGAIEYAPEYAEVLSNFAADFVSVLEAVVAHPDRRISDLPVVSRQARRPAAAWTESAPEVALEDITTAFAAQVERTPDAVAVVDGDERLTYRALAERVGQLATCLQAAGSQPDAPIAVLLDRSADAIVALLAVLEAGRAYLPLDPALPPDRLAYMLDHARAAIVVTREDVVHGREIDPQMLRDRTVVRLDLERQAMREIRPSAPAPALPEQLAYVLYTSGSTGRPKAVAIPRRALSNYTRVARERFQLGRRDRVLQFASLSFDTSAEEIYPTLTSGATLVLRTEAMLASVPAFLGACDDRGITVLDLPTAYWHQLTAQLSRSKLVVPEQLRLVILGGEKALAERVREWRASVGSRVTLLNTYGPTEATVVAAMCDLSKLAEIGDEVPLGPAIPNAQAYVLDADLVTPANGAMGELYIGGLGLARGYLGDAALTAERFVPDPCTGTAGARLYRTGDLARMDAEGTIWFGGRADDQVKLRGYRIELGEIESVLAQCPAIRDAAVMVREDHPGDRRLVGYLVPFAASATLTTDVRRFLNERLPEYMIPSAFVAIDALPRSVQGKVVRANLPAPVQSPEHDTHYVAPQSDLERRIAALWGEVLHRNRVGVLDNFFDLGGHSLLVIQLHAKLCDSFGADLAVVDLFRFPTVQSQAARLAQREPKPAAMDAVLDRATRQRQAFRRRPAAISDTVA